MDNLSENTLEKLENLKKYIQNFNGTIVAFSGGIDSSLLLYISRKVLGNMNTLGVISRSESLKTKDFILAELFCKTYDIRLKVIQTKEIEDKHYIVNPPDRCFFCKTYLYNALKEVQQQHPDFVIMNGTNIDDLGDYRPGLQAAQQFKVVSPLSECSISKTDIREIAKYYNLLNWDKPASPCLSSRIPYNYTISAEKLRQIEEAEEALYTLGFGDVRVRHYGKTCKIEVEKNEVGRLKKIEKSVSSIMKSLGFTECIIDEEGLVSGKLNRALINTN